MSTVISLSVYDSIKSVKFSSLQSMNFTTPPFYMDFALPNATMMTRSPASQYALPTSSTRFPAARTCPPPARTCRWSSPHTERPATVFPTMVRLAMTHAVQERPATKLSAVKNSPTPLSIPRRLPTPLSAQERMTTTLSAPTGRR